MCSGQIVTVCVCVEMALMRGDDGGIEGKLERRLQRQWIRGFILLSLKAEFGNLFGK